MSFYGDWLSASDKRKRAKYIELYLNMASESIEPLKSGNKSDCNCAYNAITITPLKEFIDVLMTQKLKKVLNPNDIPQFSSFSDGAVRTSELLAFYPDGETFPELGSQLVNSRKVDANRKYGENHAKLAETLSLVEIDYSRPCVAKNTALGNFLISFAYEEKEELFKRLLLRNYFVQLIIYDAYHGEASYSAIIDSRMEEPLSASTRTRRRPNTREIIKIILEGSEHENLLKNIVW